MAPTGEGVEFVFPNSECNRTSSPGNELLILHPLLILLTRAGSEIAPDIALWVTLFLIKI